MAARIRKAKLYRNRREDRRYYFPAPEHAKYFPRKLNAATIVHLLSTLNWNWYEVLEQIYRNAPIREVMKAATESSDPEVIANCLRMLGMREARLAVDFIIPFLESPSSYVRQMAAGALTELSRPIQRLGEPSLAVTHPNLGEIVLNRFKASIERLHWLACEVVEGRVTSKEAITEKVEAYTLAGTLGAIGYQPAMPVLLSALNDPDSRLRTSVAVSLSVLEAHEAFDALQEHILHEQSADVFDFIQRRLNEMSRKSHSEGMITKEE